MCRIVWAGSRVYAEKPAVVYCLVKHYCKNAFFGILFSPVVGENLCQTAIGKQLIITYGTAETCFEKNYPNVILRKYDEYADSCNAFLEGDSAAFSADKAEALAREIRNPCFTVGINALDEEKFFPADYKATLASVYGDAANHGNIVESDKVN